jgi:pimeloyl-ACP methyl ester carboxylesterase
MLRLVGKLLLGIVLLVVVAAAALGGYRAWCQNEGERALAISTANGVDDGLFVDVGGVAQWITIRGTDRRNPVLLVVHGGPGTALSPLATAFLPYERDWTVVQWDQPGAGRTFSRAGHTLPPTTTVASIAADGIAVTEHVAQRLGKDRVVLVGLSFGSVVGLEMARARPDLFVACVGTGLFVHRDDGRAIAYERALDRAREEDRSEAIAALEAVGAPPYARADDARTMSRWIDALSRSSDADPADRLAEILLAPRQSLSDVASYFGGYAASDEHFDLGRMDLRRSGAEFAVPIVIIQGAEDYDTPIELARAYLDAITAPSKVLIALPNGGHTAFVYDRTSFLAALDQHVRPLALSDAR